MRSTPELLGPIRKTFGAGDEVRTRDIQLGRLTLYQLSYSRGRQWMGKDSNLRSAVRGRFTVCSLWPTRAPILVVWNASCRWVPWRLVSWRWDSNPQPPDYKSGALPIELRQRGLKGPPGGRWGRKKGKKKRRVREARKWARCMAADPAGGQAAPGRVKRAGAGFCGQKHGSGGTKTSDLRLFGPSKP